MLLVVESSTQDADLTLCCAHLLSLQIRKAAQHGVCSVLKGSDFMFGEKAPTHHPAAVSTAKFCIQEIEKSGGEVARTRAGGGQVWAVQED